MIHFNELYITDDGQQLVVDVEIDDFSVYDECYLSRIQLTTDTECGEALNFSTAETLWEERSRHKRLCVSAAQLKTLNVSDFTERLFFVRVEAAGCGGEVGMMGCGWDTNEITGVVFNDYPFYKALLNQAATYSDNCGEGADGFTDLILRYNAFMLALRCGEYCQAAEYWKLLNGGGVSSSSSAKGCGCHGSY